MSVHISPPANFATTDAGIRSYSQTLCGAMDAVGFNRTTDTGQYDPATITWLATGAGLGETIYDIRAFDDEWSSTLPIIVKLSWARGNTTGTGTGFILRVGTQTDGAGTFVGQSHQVYAQGSSAWAGFLQSYNSTTSFTDVFYTTKGSGYFGMFTASTRLFGYMICRLFEDGSPTDRGFLLYYRNGSDIYTVEYDRLTGVFRNLAPSYTLVPQGRTTSANPSTGLDVYRHWTNIGDLRVNPYAVSVHPGEHTIGNTFTADPITGDVRTFMPFTGYKGADAGSPGVDRSTSCLAVRWE